MPKEKPPVSQKGKGRHGNRYEGQTDNKGRPVSPINGQPVPESEAAKATRFFTGDPRAKEAQAKSTVVQKERGDLRRLCLNWLYDDSGRDKNGNPVSGGNLWLSWLLKQAKEGNMKALEMLRDTAGFKPVDKVMVAEIDPEVIDEVEKLVEEAGNA